MILDADYITEDGKPVIRLFKKENGEFKIEYDRTFKPYIYALLKDDSAIDEVRKVTAERHGKIVRIIDVEKVKKKYLGRPIEVWKLYFEHPQDVPAIREKIREHPAVVEIFEYDIPFAKRYLIDKGIVPMDGDEELKLLAFDIETLYHEGEEFGKGPILMISYADEEGAKVITWKRINLPYVEVVSSEREMIKRFLKVIREKDPDVIITYNGDSFDFPYLVKRAEKLGIKLPLGRDGSPPKMQRLGDMNAVEIKGRIHFDLYHVVRRTINLPTYTLEAVYEAIFGKPKEKVYAHEIAEAWETGKGLERVAKYSMEDAQVTYELGKEFFPMEVQLTRLVGQPLWDVSRSSTGNLVEWYLLRKAYERNELAPNKPDEREYERRLRESYAGGYVKEPERGLWENIVYLDFRCHPPDTKVIVKGRGIVNISEVKEGDYVLGIDGWQKVQKVWEYNYKGELINVNGLKCTPNHKLPVVSGNGKQALIHDILAKSLLTEGIKGKLITTPFFEKIGKIEETKLPEEDVLKGELAGIILAGNKGTTFHQNGIEITIRENGEEVIQRITYILQRLFGVTPTVLQKDGSNAMTLKVAKEEAYSKIKRLINDIEKLHAPSVLKGFFEGCGIVDKTEKSIVATQEAEEKWKLSLISKLLEKLGIPHSISEHTYSENGKPLTKYILEIKGKDSLILFQTMIGFISKAKNQTLAEIIRESNNIGNNSFYKLSDFEVTTEYYEGKVYDLTLEGTPYYFANGILTHNSLYPSIIITHNVSPDTLNREGCRKYDIAPEVGHKFCKDVEGFIPSLLGHLLEERQKIKRKMKATINPVEKKLLDYRQKAIKILANSILPDEWIPILENGRLKFYRIGEFIDNLIKRNANLVIRNGSTEVLETKNIMAISFDRKTKTSRVKPIKAVIRHSYSGNIYKIKLTSGRTIKITHGHSLFVFRNGDLIEVKGEEVREGDLIAVPMRIKLPEKPERINIVEILLSLPPEETSDVTMTIPIKGRENFFNEMLRTLRWIFGEEERPKTAKRYLEHLERLNYLKLTKTGYKVLNEDALREYRKLYERLVKVIQYNKDKGEYLVNFNAIRDVLPLMPEKELKEWYISSNNGFRMKPFIELDNDFAKLLGHYVREGSAEKLRNSQNCMVRLYSRDSKALNDIEKLAIKFFGKIKRAQDYIEIPEKTAYLLFKGLCGNHLEKKIPEQIFTSPYNVRLAFLEGYLNGNIHTSKFLIKSELLTNEIIFLLNSLGVSSIKIDKDSNSYSVYINEELSEKKNAYNPYSLPKDVLEEVLRKTLKKDIGYEKVQELIESGELDEGKAKKIEWLLKGDIALDRVKSVEVEDYEGYVYDLSVEEDENFLVGFGLLYAHNSYYGYYGYAKARWYCKECAESVTAWGREYIELVRKELEGKFGFKVLYIDTDGLYATIPRGDPAEIKKKALEFVRYINEKLPGLLELEYEGFYRRGFFVTKKKYALIDEEDKIITRGLEIVRRDWSEIAKETQAKVLEAILKEGNVEKAVKIVKEVTEKLMKYEVPPEKLVIYEQITRPLNEYKAIGPHVAVAKRLAAKGVKVRPGMVIGYIVLRGDGPISKRAILAEEYDPRKNKYDAEYYIENQVLPAVLRILEAFGYKKEDLKYQKSRQVGLGAWIKVKK
ncbi:DNA polymerase domain-containing protein [Pyrococcus sp. ST04]|uniref:DNA polymerase domain-containing protein n=1 Tax=Pyrococcus sp. ST04 TaxID=1183377 RepID=UPI0002605A21|nr:DNA polymerase domain-containing protein [Pyrococcus sp. ST04]AFK21970.1 DNA-dependent DNA polymerase family B protein [Pyrococcus sp. ST04]